MLKKVLPGTRGRFFGVLQRQSARFYCTPKPYEALPDAGSIMPFFVQAGYNSVNSIHAIAKAHGDIVRYNGFFGEPTVLISHPELYKELGQLAELRYRPGTAHSFTIAYDILTGETGFRGLVMRNGKDWEKLRKMANASLLHPQAAPSFLGPVTSAAEGLLSDFKKYKEGQLTVNDAFNVFTITAIMKVAFGSEISPEDQKGVIKGVQAFFWFANKHLATQPPFPADDLAILQKELTVLKEVALKIIRREKQNIKEGKQGTFTVALFCAEVDENGEPLSDLEILANVFDLFVGGVDTTSATLQFLFPLLGKNPDVQEKIYAESKSAHAGMTVDEWNDMEYIAAVLKEGMRLYPATPLNGRATGEHGAVLGGYRLPPHCTVVINTWMIQKDPRWWENPEQFDPSRWIDHKTGSPHGHQFAWGTFGHGARSCVGQRLSQLESKIAVATLINNFKVGYSGDLPGWLPGITICPSAPVELELTARE